MIGTEKEKKKIERSLSKNIMESITGCARAIPSNR